MQVKIFKVAKNAMQSGKGRQNQWRLAFVSREKSKFIEPVMGWVGSSDSKQQLELSFSSKEAAINYAKQQGLEYEVTIPKAILVRSKSYADNFV